MTLVGRRTPWRLSHELDGSDMNAASPWSQDTGGGGDEGLSTELGRPMEGSWLDGLMGRDQASGVEVVQGRRRVGQ